MNISKVKVDLRHAGITYVESGKPVKKTYKIGSCDMHRVTYYLLEDKDKTNGVDGVLYMMGSNVMAIKDSTDHMFEFFNMKQIFSQSVF